MTHNPTKLLRGVELFRSYPGGFAGLAADTKISDSHLRRIAALEFVAPPWDRLRAIAGAKRWVAVETFAHRNPSATELLARLGWTG